MPIFEDISRMSQLLICAFEQNMMWLGRFNLFFFFQESLKIELQETDIDIFNSMFRDLSQRLIRCMFHGGVVV